MKGGSGVELLPPFLFLESLIRRRIIPSHLDRSTGKQILPIRVPSSEQKMDRPIDGTGELC